MITNNYKKLVKSMLMATNNIDSNYMTVRREGTASDFDPLTITPAVGTNYKINATCLNFGYSNSASYRGFPLVVNTSKATDYQYGVGFLFLKNVVEFDPDMYTVGSGNVETSQYLTINSLKAVKRYDSTDASTYIDFYIELKNTGTDITLTGIAFQQNVSYCEYDSYAASLPTAKQSVLFDVTNFPEPITVSSVKNENILYSFKLI